MTYIDFTYQFHTASREEREALKKKYPRYYTEMMNLAWSQIALIRARKQDKVVDKDPQIS